MKKGIKGPLLFFFFSAWKRLKESLIYKGMEEMVTDSHTGHQPARKRVVLLLEPNPLIETDVASMRSPSRKG